MCTKNMFPVGSIALLRHNYACKLINYKLVVVEHKTITMKQDIMTEINNSIFSQFVFLFAKHTSKRNVIYVTDNGLNVDINKFIDKWCVSNYRPGRKKNPVHLINGYDFIDLYPVFYINYIVNEK